MIPHSLTHAAAADGTMLAVRTIDGDGPLIVGLHGFTGDGTTLLPLLNAVRDGRPVMAPDIVGHGESGVPDHTEPYTMASVVDQVLSLIGPRPPGSVHLVGYSMGGRIALSIAARAPWYFASITTISASAGIADPTERAARATQDDALATRLEAIGIEAFIDEWLELSLFEPYVRALDEKGRVETVAQRRTNSTTGLARSLRGTGTGAMPPVWAALGSLRSPLLAVAGALDSKYVDIATEMAERAPNGTARIVEGAGHVVHVEKLVDVSTLLGEFLPSCERAWDE